MRYRGAAVEAKVEKNERRNRPPTKVGMSLALLVIIVPRIMSMSKYFAAIKYVLTHNDPTGSDKDREATTSPIRKPDEQSANHLSNLEDRENNTSRSSSILRKIKVCEICRKRVDASHERTIISVHRRAQIDQDAHEVQFAMTLSECFWLIRTQRSCLEGMSVVD